MAAVWPPIFTLQTKLSRADFELFFIFFVYNGTVLLQRGYTKGKVVKILRK
jgi:hypothetical protein